MNGNQKPRIRYSWKSQAWLPISRTFIPAAELEACQMANGLQIQALLTHHTHPERVKQMWDAAFRLHDTSSCELRVLQ